MRDLFGQFARPLAPVIEVTDRFHPIHRTELSEVPVRDWSWDNGILIGDAAHGCAPSMAQGASLAFEDAVTLADCLTQEPGLRSALSAFNQRRLARVQWVQKQCHARDSTRSLPTVARNAVLRLFGDRLYRRAYSPLLEPFTDVKGFA
jgi:2-heptyl-3-hydroxy-4(1H)-quinolone synthase